MSFFKYVKDHRFQLLGTFLTYFSMIIYSCRSVSTPVALLDLQIQVQEPFSVTSRLVTAYSVGYFFGGFALGFIDGKCHNYLIQAATNILGGIFLSFVPSFTNIVMIFPLIGLSGFMNSLCETASNVVLIDLWGEEVCNYLQILYVAFGVGGLIAPIMIRPYQLPIPEECTEDPDRVLDYYKPEDVQIRYPYYIILAMSLAIGISFILCYYFTVHRKKEEEETEDEKKKEQKAEQETGQEIQLKGTTELSPPKDHPFIKKAVAVGWVALLGHVGFSMQLILIGFGQAFGVKSSLRIEKRKAALISSTYWIAYCSSKIVFVVFSTIIKEKIMVVSSAILLLIGIILSFSLAHSIEICLWSVAFLVGVGFGPLFTVAFASLEKYFRVTGRHTSLIYMTVVAGESIHVPIVGTFIDDWPGIYLYYSGMLSAVFLAGFIAMPYVCKLLFGDAEESTMIDKVTNIPRSSRFGSIIAPVPERRASIMSIANRDQPERQRSSSVWSKA